MHFHYQNLNEKRNGKKGSILRNGRAWLNFGKSYSSYPELRLEWCVPTRLFHIAFTFGEPYEDTVQCSVACGLFAFWITLEGRWQGLPQNRRCEISFHHWTLWINPWSKAHEWCGSDPWWVRGVSLDIPDLLLGRTKCTKEILRTEQVVVPMPEGCYPATATFDEMTFKRPRWFTRKRRGVWLDFPLGGGIPHRGKGTASWNCGEDALCGCGVEGESLDRAVAHATERALEYRRRYGNVSDLPVVFSPRVKDLNGQQPNN